MPAVRDRATGIWNHVRLRSTGDAVIGDPHVTTKLPTLPRHLRRRITIAVPVRNAGTTDPHDHASRAAFDGTSRSPDA